MILILSENFSNKSKLILNKFNGRFYWNLLNNKFISTTKVKNLLVFDFITIFIHIFFFLDKR